MVALSTPAPMAVDLKATPVADGSSFGRARKHPREIPADMHPDTRNLFGRMPTTDDETTNRFTIKNIIFKGGVAAATSAGGASAAA